jgi:C4-dicarboxylate transporter DctQ subunit
VSRSFGSFLLKLSNFFEITSEIFNGFFVVATTLLIALQVFLRYILNLNLAWGEEVSRFMMIWAVMMVTSILIKHDELIKVDFFDELWPKTFIKYRDLIYKAALLAIFFFYIREGWDQAISSYNQSIPSLNLSWFWPYLAIPVGFALMLIQTLLATYLQFFGTGNGSSKEEEKGAE